jgi:hypothetical protein
MYVEKLWALALLIKDCFGKIILYLLHYMILVAEGSLRQTNNDVHISKKVLYSSKKLVNNYVCI